MTEATALFHITPPWRDTHSEWQTLLTQFFLPPSLRSFIVS